MTSTDCDQAGTDIILQSAAIPYRNSDLNGVEVLLVTSRKRSRWVLPKGKVKRGMLAHRSAAREAFEEAGVVGTISAVPVGTYRQLKTQEDGQAEMIAVRAFPMLVHQENVSWPEMRQRERCWMPINAAVEAVKNSELRALLITFAGALPNLA
jgi:8-oxo-dGTP pyrophosphatase MutT (NUDIX family)